MPIYNLYTVGATWDIIWYCLYDKLRVNLISTDLGWPLMQRGPTVWIYIFVLVLREFGRSVFSLHRTFGLNLNLCLWEWTVSISRLVFFFFQTRFKVLFYAMYWSLRTIQQFEGPCEMLLYPIYIISIKRLFSLPVYLPWLHFITVGGQAVFTHHARH